MFQGVEPDEFTELKNQVSGTGAWMNYGMLESESDLVMLGFHRVKPWLCQL